MPPVLPKEPIVTTYNTNPTEVEWQKYILSFMGAPRKKEPSLPWEMNSQL